MRFTLLDGPLGTELLARGVPTPTPLWSAAALLSAPDVVRAIHSDYAAAGATVHTANTFRTRRRTTPDWRQLTDLAVRLARAAVPAGQRVAGSMAPLEDCYRPDLSPVAPRAEHRELAQALAAAGCDLLLCETFPHVGEALVAVEEAVATGLPAWVSFTAGPDADLLSPAQIAAGAREAIARGAVAVLVNCVPASRTLPYVLALADVAGPLGVAFGAYANAGRPDEGMGWRNPLDQPGAPRAYARHVETWLAAGATLVGGCCGTSPAAIRAIAALM